MHKNPLPGSGKMCGRTPGCRVAAALGQMVMAAAEGILEWTRHWGDYTRGVWVRGRCRQAEAPRVLRQTDK